MTQRSKEKCDLQKAKKINTQLSCSLQKNLLEDLRKITETY